MKRLHFYLGLAIFVGILVSISLLVGCNEQLTESPQSLLIKPPADWIEKYGDSLESRQTANIVLAVQVINNQGKAIKELDERLKVIEIPKEAIAIVDPNELE